MTSRQKQGGLPEAKRTSKPARSTRHATIARAILAARKNAGQRFGFDLAVDPIGDMLLDLYIREHDGRTTSLSSL